MKIKIYAGQSSVTELTRNDHTGEWTTKKNNANLPEKTIEEIKKLLKDA
jgi:hypothetical protein